MIGQHSMTEFSDETLMAFADGELDAETERRLEEALAADEALAERLAIFLDSRALVASAMKPVADEPVPAALTASLQASIAAAKANANATETGTGNQSETVVPFTPRAPRRAVIGSGWRTALAASVVGLAIGLGGFLLGQSTSVGPDRQTAALHAALSTVPSGADTALMGEGGTLQMIASFRDGEGHLCREYELTAARSVTTGIACHGPAGWQTRLALSNPVAEGYVPASAPETIDEFLAGIGAGVPLSAEEETADMAAIGKK